MLHRARSPETSLPAEEDADPRSPIPEELLERVARVEDRLHSACAADKEEIAPKLAHLRSAIGEMTELYESRFAEVRARNQQAFDELQKLAGRVARRDSRIAAQPEHRHNEQTSEQNSAPETPEQTRPKEVPQRTPEPVRKAPKEKEAPPEKENPAPKETKSKTRRSRKKRAAGPPGLPIGIGALPTAQPGWLAQAVGSEALGGGADPTAVAEAMRPWFRAAQALANPLDAEVRFEETALAPPPPEPATAGPSPTRPSFGKQPATPGAYTPFIPGLLATPSPCWEPPDRASFGGLLKRPALQLSLNNMVPVAGTA